MLKDNIQVPATVTISPGRVSGNVYAPASKSSMQRACAAALISKSISRIHNPGISNDDMASLHVIRSLGAKVSRQDDGSLLVDSSETQAAKALQINFGESGLGIRMFTPIAALNKFPVKITGEGSLLSRPMDFFDEVLPQLNVQVKSSQGRLPIEISGGLVPKDITIDGSLSSQFLTGLLFAYAAADAQDVTITVNNLNSRPYIDLTLQVLQDFGLPVPVNNNYTSFYFPGRTSKNVAAMEGRELETRPVAHYTVEGDWSGAAFLLVAGAVAGNISVKGLDAFSPQADKKILEALMDAGCSISVRENEIKISDAAGLKAFQINATDCPDLFPPLVALASFCTGKSVIEGVHRLAHKESHRAKTLMEEFSKLGVNISLQDNLMIVQGVEQVRSAKVHSHNDHRIAMACAVAALRAAGDVIIEQANAVKKSYPAFYRDLEMLRVK